jgi:predicted deacylase
MRYPAEFWNTMTGSQSGTLSLFEDVEIPFAVIQGTRPGPRLLVTAGVHGSEFCSIEAAIRLMRIPPEQIKGTLTILPIVNTQGFYKRSIYVMPQDGKNLNRMFPGRPDGSTSERVAHWLVTQAYPRADAYLDLHGGDLDEALVPFSIVPRESDVSMDLAVAFGIPVIVKARPGGMTVNAAFKLGVPGVLAEMSGNGLWGEDSVAVLTNGVRNVMRHLGMLDADPAAPATPQAAATEVVSMWVPLAPASGLWYPRHELRDPVAAGDLLGEIRSIFGEVLASIHSEAAGFILYRLTSLSVNEGEALLGVATPA